MQEEWRDVVGYEDYFKVSNLGNVYSKRTSKVLKQHVRKDRRVTIATRIGGRNGRSIAFRVHRLVAEAFIPNPENKLTVNHIDGNPSNNILLNLEWATHSENTRHAIETGLIKFTRGKSHPLSKATDQLISFIKNNYIPFNKEFGARAISRKLNINHNLVVKMFNYP